LYLDPILAYFPATSGRVIAVSTPLRAVSSDEGSNPSPSAFHLRATGIDSMNPHLRLDVEAEHHPALVVLGDVAMRHPATRVRDVEEDVDRFAGAHEHRVLPDQVRLDHVF